MKRRLSAVLLALGLTVSALSTGVYAAETETTAATEQVTEAATEAATEQETETVTEKATEAATEAAAAEAVAELESEIAELESEAAQAETETLSEEEQLKQSFAQMLTQFAAYTDEQLAQMMESDDASSRLLAVNWSSVKEEVGAFVEVTRVESNYTETGYGYIAHTKYEKTGDTDVVVTYEIDMKTQQVTCTWDVQYSMGKQIERAALNTAMGIGIVFFVLVFLILVIGRLHIIPDMIEKKAKANAPEPAPAPAPAAPAAAAVVEEEEDLMDDLELVAVITAAIAASETTSGDGFVVRSIKKANRRNWQRA